MAHVARHMQCYKCSMNKFAKLALGVKKSASTTSE